VLGFVAAFLALDFFGANSSKAPAIFFPVLVTALPLLDSALATVRRLQSHSSPTTGDRRHFYDLLLARGWSSRRVLLICVGITASLGFIGWLTVQASFAHAALLAAASAVALLVWMISLGSLRANDENLRTEAVQPQYDPRA
jgi:Flp pilus assembly protein TadB